MKGVAKEEGFKQIETMREKTAGMDFSSKVTFSAGMAESRILMRQKHLSMLTESFMRQRRTEEIRPGARNSISHRGFAQQIKKHRDTYKG
jgi:hypothetical protein